MDKKELEQLICSTLNIPFVSQTIKRQITKFIVERKLTYDDIARALIFYIEIEKQPYEQRYGISFIEWIADDAKAYYERQERKEKKQLESTKNQTNIILKIKEFKKRKPIEKIDLGDLGDD